MRRRALSFALACSCAASVHADVVFDRSFGAASNVNLPKVGSTYTIASTDGRSVGANLFHSFFAFGIGGGDTANFTGTGYGNVIARVTGGSRSLIEGTLRSSVTGVTAPPAFWFINPWGVTFGQNAVIDVPGAFHASSASYLRLGAGGRFDALNPGASTLTVDSPSAFGFTGPAAGIEVKGLRMLTPGTTLSLVGGAITVTSGTAATARIEAPQGRINLASVSGPGEAALLPDGTFDMTAAGTLGAITLTNAIVHTETTGAAGPIAIRGGRLTLTDSIVSTLNRSAVAGSSIDIGLTDEFSMSGGIMRASSIGAGDAGNIAIRAAGVSLAAGAVIDTSSINFSSSGASGSGRAGQTTIDATGDVVLRSGSALTSITFLGSGPGGDTRINARSLTVRDGANIKVSTFGHGTAGRVRIAVQQDLTLAGGGHIDANTEFDNRVSLEDGTGGSILVERSNRVDISDAGSGLFSRTSSEGAGGSIVVNAGEIALRDGGRISSANLDPFGFGTIGNAGSIQLAAARTVEIAGAGSGLFSSTVSGGAGGAIAVSARDILVRDGGRISGETSNPNRLATRIGNAGSIQLVATGAVEISGAGAGLFSSTRSSGAGGTIAVSARDILVRDGGRISGESSNPDGLPGRTGDAGSIALDAARSIRLESGGAITTESEGAGGGRIVIRAGDLLALDRSRITTSVRFGGGNGGDILIDPVFVTLNASDIIARAVDGNGGNIFIVTQFLLQSPDSAIDATSQRGISGSVQISSPASDVGSRLGVLASGYVDPSSLLREACAARAGRAGSSFVGVGRGGLPASPDSAAYADYGSGASRAAWLGLTIRAASCPDRHTG